jgi:pantetheine-phosphate adenylyltransferase
MIRAVYPGTFDPIHNGHVDIATRTSALFDELIVGVYDASPKSLLFETRKRVTLAEQALRHLPNVRVVPYRGLTVGFARELGAKVIVRGLRAISDFEFEFQMALTNKTLAPEIEFISLMTSLEHAYLSSSILKFGVGAAARSGSSARSFRRTGPQRSERGADGKLPRLTAIGA